MIQILYTSFQSKLRYEVYGLYFRSFPEHLQSKMFRYTRWQDAQSFFLGKVLLIECLCRFGFNIDCLRKIEHTENERPFLPDSGIDFNVSHSGAYVLCCASNESRVGIDIEEIKLIDIHDFRAQFTGDEMLNITNSNAPHQCFFELWSKKEAIVKADGRGLSFPLKEIVFESETRASVEETTWYLNRIQIDSHFSSYLATDKPIKGEVLPEELQFQCM